MPCRRKRLILAAEFRIRVRGGTLLDCFAALAMTIGRHCEERSDEAIQQDGPVALGSQRAPATPPRSCPARRAGKRSAFRRVASVQRWGVGREAETGCAPARRRRTPPALPCRREQADARCGNPNPVRGGKLLDCVAALAMTAGEGASLRGVQRRRSPEGRAVRAVRPSARWAGTRSACRGVAAVWRWGVCRSAKRPPRGPVHGFRRYDRQCLAGGEFPGEQHQVVFRAARARHDPAVVVQEEGGGTLPDCFSALAMAA